MRVILVGSPARRARLRAQLSATAVEVVAEFFTLAEARAAAGVGDRGDAINGVDGILLSPEGHVDGDMGNERQLVARDERHVAIGNDREFALGNQRKLAM